MNNKEEEGGIVKLLEEWGFLKYIEVFQENEVDIPALLLIDDAQVRELIPAIGPQVKFKKALSAWKLSQEKSNEILDTEEVLEEVISKYGDSLEEGFSSSLTSSIQTLPASPSTSILSVSTVSSYAQSDLTLLLESTPDGQLLLKHNREKPLGEQYRKILVRLISKEIVRHNPKAPVTAETYLSWLQEIERLFPSENLACYYTKPKAGLQRAHGRLSDAVSNLKSKYRRHKVYEPRARRSIILTSCSEEPSTSTSSQSVHSEEPITQEEEECLEWLRCTSDDYALCVEKWQKTNKERKQRVLSNEKQSYLQEFPCLRRSWGHELLTADFDRWYPENKYALEDKLPLLRTKLLCASKTTSRQSPFVEELKQLAQDQDPERSNLAALLLIPHMIGPVHLKKKRISSAEVRQCFILQIEEERQLLEERLKRQDRYKALGITVQPYIIVAGPLEKITARYVVVDDIIYELPNISKTVDTCFKIIWALNLEYPSECLPVWQFLERAIYNFPANVVSKNRLSTSVLSLLSDCGISSV